MARIVFLCKIVFVKNIVIGLLIISLFSFVSFSQTSKDTTITLTDSISKFTPSSYCWWAEQYIYIDTALTIFHENSDFNRISYPFMTNTGNVGSVPYFYKFSWDSLFLNTPFNQIDLLKTLSSLDGLYYSSRPYSHIQFVSGPKNEQDILAAYGIKIKNQYRIGGKFVSMGGDGMYTNSSNRISNLNLYGGYTTKNRMYNSILELEWMKANLSENGGVTEDTSGIFPVNLSDAKSIYSNRGVSLIQQLNFKFDSVAVLRNDILEERNVIPKIQFDYAVSYTSKAYQYTNTLTGDDALFYDNFFIDSTETKDSTTISDFTNCLYAHYRIVNKDKRGGYQFSLGGSYNYLSLYQNELIDTNYSNLALTFSLKKFSLKNSLFLNSGYTASGYNSGHYFVKSGFSYASLDSVKRIQTAIYATIEFQNVRPFYFHQNFYSNHFIWNNTFKDVQQFKFNSGVDLKKYKSKFQITAYQFRNYIYYGLDAEPLQESSSLTILQAELFNHFSLYKFHLNSSVLLQKATNETIIHLPLVYVKESLYFESFAFKKALLFQTGIALNFFSEYYGNYYMPALGQFYLQNEIKVGNYPFIDVYAAAKIKKVRLFVKFQHLTSDLIENHEYMIPYYPVAPRIFKWGISWVFLD